jgi:hypothetical protein
MRASFPPSRPLALVFLAVFASTPLAQVAQTGAPKDAAKDPVKDSYRSSKFWESPAPFELTLTTNVKQINADVGDPGEWRAATVSYASDGTLKTHAARIRTRGRSRLKICDRFPPLWVDFAKEDVKGTELQRLNRFKLVSPCKYAPDYERYVLGEYNIYRIHALFTPISHRTRLIKLTVRDSANGKEAFSKYAFALEDIDEVAERLQGQKLPVTGLMSTDLDQRQTALMGVLAYMVANTDFSFSARHNLEFVNVKGVIYPIIFDYDQAGVINTAYSTPDPSLGIQRVTERVYRGLCVPDDTLKKVLAEVKAKRPEIEALYKDDVGKLMGGSMSGTALRFLGGFFTDIENERKVQRDIIEKCAPAR